MATNDPTDEYRVELSESMADVAVSAAYVDELPTWNTSVDVFLPDDVARAVAYRAGMRAHREAAVTEREVHDLALDHAQTHSRFLVEHDWQQPAVPLVEWVADQGVPVDHETATVTHPDRRIFGATAQYRPDSEIPLHITLDVPEGVIEDAGGWDWLTESVRLHHRESTAVNTGGTR